MSLNRSNVKRHSVAWFFSMAGLFLSLNLSQAGTLTGVAMQGPNGINLLALNWSTKLDGSIETTNACAFIGYTISPNVYDQISYGISDGRV